MSATKTQYDIALSFCHEDLPVAMGIRDALGDSFEIFVYSKRQDEVAGTDGLQSFRDIFRNRCKLAVVLFRSKWGSTPWTRVEHEAITDRFLKEGPGFLFFVNMDDSDPLPWIPEKLIRLSFSSFGLEQAVGAIRARALEAGSVSAPPSPTQLALRAKEALEFSKRREFLFQSQEGVELAAAEGARVVSLIAAALKESRGAAPELDMALGSERFCVGARVSAVTFFSLYYNRILNVLDDAKFIIRELRGPALLPGEHGRHYFWEKPIELAVLQFTPELLLGQGWCWRDENGKVLSSEALADLAVARCFALIQRLASGELNEPEY